MKKAISSGAYTLLMLLLAVSVFILVTPFLDVEKYSHLIKPVMDYFDKLPKELGSLALLSLLVTVLISIHNIDNQQKQLSLQSEALNETIKDNNFKARYAHIEHFRSNLEEIRNNVIPNIKLRHDRGLSYGSIYSYKKLGRFNHVFEKKLNECIDELVELLTDRKFGDDLRNQVECRFVLIYEQMDMLNSLFGLSCTLERQVRPDDERMFVGQLYEYIATSFIGILSVTDGYIGDMYTDFAHLASNIDFEGYEESYAKYDELYDSDTLSELVSYIPSSR